MSFKIGDRVIIKTREVIEEDEVSRLYFSYFGGLKGTLVKMPEEGNYAVDIDLDTLRPDMLKRHKEIEKLEKKRWKDSLSAEQKRSLTPEQDDFKIAYTILVNEKDLELLKD